MANTYKFTIILTGNGAVGKTSIRNVITGRKFSTNYMVTIGADFSLKEYSYDDKQVRLQIWIVAGQERFTFI